MKPTVSIIIATFNAKKYVRRCLESIAKQDYEALEIIVIDGGSTDGTIEILKKYTRRRQLKWISEKDQGIADAFNKGLRMAKGDYLYFLGSDDVLAGGQVIKRMMRGINKDKDVFVCGRVACVDRDTLQTQTVSDIHFRPWQFLYKMALPHQGLFTNRRFFLTFGDFDTSCIYAMDYELLLRAYRRFPHVVLKNIIVAKWASGGIGADKTGAVIREYDRIRKQNRIAPAWVLSFVHLAAKVRYGLI